MFRINDEFYRKKIYDLTKLVLILALLTLTLFISYHAVFYLFPFAVAFVLSSLIEPVIRFMMFKLKIKRKYASMITVFLLFTLLGLLAALIIIKTSEEIMNLFNFLNSNNNIIDVTMSNFYNHLNPYVESVSHLFNNFPEEIYEKFQSTLSELLNSGLQIVKNVVTALVSTAFSLPAAIIYIIVMIASTYFFSSDKVLIYDFIKRSLPESWIRKLIIVKKDIFKTVGGYIKTQVILVSISFVFLSAGLVIGRIKYALVLAFVISLLDFIPMVGISTIMLPWAVYCLVVGDIKTFFLLSVILTVCFVVRQMLEPRMLGRNIGVHPLLTLLGAFVGLRMFGFAGVVIMPVLIVVLKNILSEIFMLFSIKEILSFKKAK